MTAKFISVVTLLEFPSPTSPFYVVESETGKHYVSSLGGRAAKGLTRGTTLKLYRSDSKHISAYHLERA
jgi:hypothetical protein